MISNDQYVLLRSEEKNRITRYVKDLEHINLDLVYKILITHTQSLPSTISSNCNWGHSDSRALSRFVIYRIDRSSDIMRDYRA